MSNTSMPFQKAITLTQEYHIYLIERVTECHSSSFTGTLDVQVRLVDVGYV